MTAIVVYALLTAACYYVAAASAIFAPIRDRLPDRVYAVLDCPFCTGFWYGLAWACALQLDITPELAGNEWPTPIVVAVMSIITTTFFAELTLFGHVRYRRAVHQARAEAGDSASGGE